MIMMNGEDKQLDLLTELMQDGEVLETPYPEDLFKFFNQQMKMLGSKLSGDLFVQVLALWAHHLESMFTRKAQDDCRGLTEEDILKLPTDINDINKCLLHLAETKGIVTDMVDDQYYDRITKLFIQMMKGLNRALEIEIDKIVEMLFSKIEEVVIDQLFRYGSIFLKTWNLTPLESNGLKMTSWNKLFRLLSHKL